MAEEIIRKGKVGRHTLTDYDAARAAFSWADARARMAGLPGGGLNMAYECLDRHVVGGAGERAALRWISKDGAVKTFTYADLTSLAAQFGDVLAHLGVKPGERVFSLLGRVPDLYVTALGTLRSGRVFSPLFSAFGPGPVKARVGLGDGRVLVTSLELYKRKVASWRAEMPGLKHVLIVNAGSEEELPPGTWSLAHLMGDGSAETPVADTDSEDMALLHFTSGTTGRPKGAIHVHEAVVAHAMTGRYALDMQPGDIFWCTADPGWVTGTSYGIIAPLANGLTMIVDEQEFDAERWYRILQDEKVTIWYTAPTAIRMLMKTGGELAKQYDLSSVRFMASVGEPLNPEAVIWSNAQFGQPFHDNWWQTETGGIMISNYAALDVKPGSMGRPLPGIEAAIVKRTGPDSAEEVGPDTVGELALKRGWPSMMRGYLNEEARYKKAFAGEWYISGDLAKRDTGGYFWFVGRDDDVIKSAGHLIGPFEVESALMEHPSVAEAGVIGIPEPTAGEVVKAYVALKPGFEAGEDLRKQLLGHARKRLGPAIAPREIAFRENLPKTRSGKIMRRLLKARELGLPEGDISTLESDEK